MHAKTTKSTATKRNWPEKKRNWTRKSVDIYKNWCIYYALITNNKIKTLSSTLMYLTQTEQQKSNPNHRSQWQDQQQLWHLLFRLSFIFSNKKLQHWQQAIKHHWNFRSRSHSVCCSVVLFVLFSPTPHKTLFFSTIPLWKSWKGKLEGKPALFSQLLAPHIAS